MFAAREVVSLFPTMVFAAVPTLDLARMNGAARSRLRGSGSRRQTPPDLQRDPAFAPLEAALVDAARQALDELGYLATVRPEVNALWATLAPVAQPEPLVRSGNAFFAGVLVGEAPGEQRLRAAEPRPQARILEPLTSEKNALNATEALIPLPAGRLLLFPGWLPHGLAPTPGAGERLVWRCSLLFADFVAELAPPNWDHPHGERLDA